MSEGGDAQFTGIRCKDARVGGVFQYVSACLFLWEFELIRFEYVPQTPSQCRSEHREHMIRLPGPDTDADVVDTVEAHVRAANPSMSFENYSRIMALPVREGGIWGESLEVCVYSEMRDVSVSVYVKDPNSPASNIYVRIMRTVRQPLGLEKHLLWSGTHFDRLVSVSPCPVDGGVVEAADGGKIRLSRSSLSCNSVKSVEKPQIAEPNGGGVMCRALCEAVGLTYRSFRGHKHHTFCLGWKAFIEGNVSSCERCLEMNSELTKHASALGITPSLVEACQSIDAKQLALNWNVLQPSPVLDNVVAKANGRNAEDAPQPKRHKPEGDEISVEEAGNQRREEETPKPKRHRPSDDSAFGEGDIIALKTPVKHVSRENLTVDEWIHANPRDRITWFGGVSGAKVAVYCGLCERIVEARKACNAKYVISPPCAD